MQVESGKTYIGWVKKEKSCRGGNRIKVEVRSLSVLRHAS